MILNSVELASQPFTHTLQSFNKVLENIAWKEDLPGVVFIRDYENMPERSPFDIDLLVPENQSKKLLQIMSEKAEEAGLVVVSKEGKNSLLILFFDASPCATGRRWAYYEIRNEMELRENYIVNSEMVSINYDAGLPCPGKDWKFILDFVQAVRKRKLERRFEDFKEKLNHGVDDVSWIVNVLDCTGHRLVEYVSGSVSNDVIAKELKISFPLEKKLNKESIKTRIKKKLLHNLTFLQSSSIYLYTIHGPDGVGKSTVCEIVESVFSGYPLPFINFHHVTGWKHNNQININAKSEKIPEKISSKKDLRPLWRKILSVIYRRLPAWMKNIWVLNVGYIRYCSNLNKLIMRKHKEGNIILVDRYLHDMWIKNKLQENGPVIIDYLYARLFRKPRLALMLNDRPENIIKRKQELSLEAIDSYQTLIAEALDKTKVNNTNIDVEGSSAEQVAEKVIIIILTNMDENAIDLMRANVARSKQLNHV